MKTLALCLLVSLGLAATAAAQVGYCGTGRICYSTKYLGAAGSASAPTYSFAGDPDTGIYRSAANTVAIAAGGSLAATISSNNIGGAGFVTAAIGSGFNLGGSTVLGSVSSNGTTLVQGWGPAATVTNVVPQMILRSGVALDANDLLLGIQNSAGTNLMTFDIEGDIVATTVLTSGNLIATGGVCVTSTCTVYWDDSGGLMTSNVGVSAPSLTLGTALTMANGGTGQTSTGSNGGVAYTTGAAIGFTAAGTTGQVLTSVGAGTPVWANGPGTVYQCDNIDFAAPASGGACSKLTCTVTACTVGNQAEIWPMQDDVAWDTGQLSAWCEDATTVGMTYCGATTNNPAATNDFKIRVTSP